MKEAPRLCEISQTSTLWTISHGQELLLHYFLGCLVCTSPGPALALVPRHHQQRRAFCTWFKTPMSQTKALKPSWGRKDFPAESQSHQTEYLLAVGGIKVKMSWGNVLSRDSHSDFRHEAIKSKLLSTCIRISGLRRWASLGVRTQATEKQVPSEVH